MIILFYHCNHVLITYRRGKPLDADNENKDKLTIVLEPDILQ